MSRRAPGQVWISWCDECGLPDYAFHIRPKKIDVPACPRCQTAPEFQRVAGPYVAAQAPGKAQGDGGT